MSLTEEEKKQIVLYRLEKSKHTLDDAQKIIELNMWATAANRLYYAAYYAVSALLVLNNINAKTHDGIIRMFNQHFVYTGKIDRELARQYNSLYTMRLTSDYGDCFDLQENDVLPVVEPAKTFIAKIWEIIENSLS